MKIKRLVIRDLYGYQTVDLPFDSNCKIIIGENGLGKTTVLNTLYYILSMKFEKLNKLNFSTIELYLDAKRKIVISKAELKYYIERPQIREKSHFYEILANNSKEENIKALKAIMSERKPIQDRRIEVTNYLKNIGIRINAPSSFIYETLTKFLAEYEMNGFLEVISEIDKLKDCKILYFPTYRRIEEDLKNIGVLPRKELLERYSPFLDEEILNNELEKGIDDDVIQFGMSDVDERIKHLTQEITKLSMIGFSEITGEMLHQLLNDFPDAKPKKATKHDIEKLQIILDRVKSNITSEDKERIMGLIKSGKSNNIGLFYFIDKLIELYNKQEVIDTAIKKFVEVCNYYLSSKKYIYNEKEVTLKIFRENSTEEVLLNQLSSGEKQIVSLFSKVYLELDSNFIILFDEPELSLSVFWQQRLLTDILNSNKCKFLFAATHSPFIYDNELEKYAVGLNEYISYKK